MNLITVLGLIIIFTSVIFMLFSFEVFVKETIDCSQERCVMREISSNSSIGIFIIAAFFIVDALVVWIMAKTALNG